MLDALYSAFTSPLWVVVTGVASMLGALSVGGRVLRWAARGQGHVGQPASIAVGHVVIGLQGVVSDEQPGNTKLVRGLDRKGRLDQPRWLPIMIAASLLPRAGLLATIAPLWVGCGPPERKLADAEEAGCAIGAEAGEAAGTIDGSSCADAVTEPPGLDYIVDAQTCSDISVNSDEVDPCIKAWLDAYEACYAETYLSAYELASKDANCWQ